MRKQKKKHTVLKVILLIVLILLLVATGGAFWVYQKFSDTVGEMNYRELESDKLEINQQVKENKALKGYHYRQHQQRHERDQDGLSLP